MLAPTGCRSLSHSTKPQAWEGFLRFRLRAPRYLPGPRGLPLLKPPFSSILAIDMNSGEHRWRIPVGHGRGDGRNQESGYSRSDGASVPANWGAGNQDGLDRGFRWETTGRRTSCPSSQRPMADLNNRDPHLWVYDKASGENAGGDSAAGQRDRARRSPTWPAGKQYIAFPVGGGPLVEELIAVFALSFPCVAPANAGAHTPRILVSALVAETSATISAGWLWVPASAGTTTRDLDQPRQPQQHARGAGGLPAPSACPC